MQVIEVLVSWVYIQTTEKISFNIIIITVNYYCLLHCTYWEKVQESLLIVETIFGLSKMAVLPWQQLLPYIRQEKKNSFSKVN